MYLQNDILYGDTLKQNGIPPICKGSGLISLPGVFSSRNQSISISDDILSRHILLIGGTGCGKSNAIYHMVSQLKRQMTSQDAMVIFDTKGDYYERFYNSDTDYVIANTGKYSKETQIWNIYREILSDGYDPNIVEMNIQEITRAFFKEATQKTNQIFFPNAARDLLSAILTAYVRYGKGDADFKNKEFYNVELKNFLNVGLSYNFLKRLFGDFSDLQSVLAYLGEHENTQQLGVIAELRNVMRSVLIGNFAKKGQFSVRDFIKNRNARTLFIEYDLSVGATLTPVYSLLFDLALKQALSQKAEIGRDHGNVYLICDEFRLLPYLQHINDGLNFGRSMGVKIIAGLQSVEQLNYAYKENASSILSGFSTVFSFLANDEKTRQFTTGRYGNNIVRQIYEKIDGTRQEWVHNGRSVEEWHMSQLKRGDAVIGFPENPPFLFHFDLF